MMHQSPSNKISAIVRRPLQTAVLPLQKMIESKVGSKHNSASWRGCSSGKNENHPESLQTTAIWIDKLTKNWQKAPKKSIWTNSIYRSKSDGRSAKRSVLIDLIFRFCICTWDQQKLWKIRLDLHQPIRINVFQRWFLRSVELWRTVLHCVVIAQHCALKGALKGAQHCALKGAHPSGFTIVFCPWKSCLVTVSNVSFWKVAPCYDFICFVSKQLYQKLLVGRNVVICWKYSLSKYWSNGTTLYISGKCGWHK